jgi:hypothetical protein
MTRSLTEILDHADRLAANPEDGLSPAELELRAAVLKYAAAERVILEGVRAARAQHLSWPVIGRALGVAGESARRRYRDLV